jgi:hypothetical protein
MAANDHNESPAVQRARELGLPERPYREQRYTTLLFWPLAGEKRRPPVCDCPSDCPSVALETKNAP